MQCWERPSHLQLVLDNASYDTEVTDISDLFTNWRLKRRLKLKAIHLDVRFGPLRAPLVEFKNMSDLQWAFEKFQGTLLKGQKIFLRYPEDMRATRESSGWELVHPILRREIFLHLDVFHQSRFRRVCVLWDSELSQLANMNGTLTAKRRQFREEHLLHQAHFDLMYEMTYGTIPGTLRRTIARLAMNLPELLAEEYVARDFDVMRLVKMLTDDPDSNLHKLTVTGGQIWETGIVELFRGELTLTASGSYLHVGWIDPSQRAIGYGMDQEFDTEYGCYVKFDRIFLTLGREDDEKTRYGKLYKFLVDSNCLHCLSWEEPAPCVCSAKAREVVLRYLHSDRVRRFLDPVPWLPKMFYENHRLTPRDCLILKSIFMHARSECDQCPRVRRWAADWTTVHDEQLHLRIRFMRIDDPWTEQSYESDWKPVLLAKDDPDQ